MNLIHKSKYKIILSLLFIFFLSCSNEIENNKTADEIISDSSKRVSDWNSFRFSLEHEKGLTSLSSGSYQLKSARGEIILPRRVKLETNAITLGQLIKLDVILINERSYWTNPINQKWSEIPPGQSPFGTFDVGEVVKDILTNINNPVLGEQSGEKIKISGKVDAVVFKPLVGVSDESKVADVVLEIDLSNMNVLSAKIEGIVNPLDEEGVIRIIEIWDVDSEFEVNPPF